MAGDLVNRGNERDDWDDFFENARACSTPGRSCPFSATTSARAGTSETLPEHHPAA
jgi:hypothetical protein